MSFDGGALGNGWWTRDLVPANVVPIVSLGFEGLTEVMVSGSSQRNSFLPIECDGTRGAVAC